MTKLFRTKMLPLLLIMALTASAIDLGFIQPGVVYAAEESTASQQGTQASSTIVLGKGTIEINGHLFTDAEFQTFLSNAKIYRVPFEQPSTFALGDYGEIVGEDAQTAGDLVILSNAIIGAFQNLSVIFNLAVLAGSSYLAIGYVDEVALALDIRFLPDAIEINGIHINSFNSTLVGLTNSFVEHQNANPDEEIVDPDTIGPDGTTKPGEGAGDTTQPGEGDSDADQVFNEGKKALENADIDGFTIKDKHLNSSGGNWSKFNVATADAAKKLVKEIIAGGTINTITNNENKLGTAGQKSYKIIIDAGKVIGTKGEQLLTIVVDELRNVWSVYPSK